MSNGSFSLGLGIGGGDLFSLGVDLYAAQQQQANYEQQRADTQGDVDYGYRLIHEMGGFTGQTGGLAGQVGQLGSNLQGQSGGYYGGGAPQNRFNQAYGDLSQQYGQAQGGFNQAMQPTLAGYGRLANTLPGQYGRGAGQISAGYGQLGGQLGRGYEQRLQRGMGMLRGYGDATIRDINRSFDVSGRNMQANLASRGLSSTTVTQGAALGTQRERSGAVARAREGIAGQMFGAYAGLSGEALAAQERVGFGGLGAGERMLGYGTGLQADLQSQSLQAQSASARFGAGIGLQGLDAQAGIAGAQLGYGDLNQQMLLNNQQTYGMMGIDARWNALQAGVDWTGQIQRVPAQGYNYGWGQQG